MFRQGDIALIPVKLNKAERSSFERSAKQHRETILAAGEVTGHHHRLRSNATGGRIRRSGNLIHVTSTGAKLTHEEHGKIDVPAGDYRLVQHREYVAPTPTQRASTRRVYD